MHCDFSAARHWAGVRRDVFSPGNGLWDLGKITSECTARSLPVFVMMTPTYTPSLEAEN